MMGASLKSTERTGTRKTCLRYDVLNTLLGVALAARLVFVAKRRIEHVQKPFHADFCCTGKCHVPTFIVTYPVQ